MLKEIAQRLDDGLLTMSAGVEAIGHFLAVAADNKVAGFNADRVADMGWLLEYLGKQMNSHRHLMDCAKSELALSTIVEPEQANNP